MNRLYDFDNNKYDFVSEVENLFNYPLNKLHEIRTKEYKLFNKLGKDCESEFHQKFYKKYNNGWDEVVNLYNLFVKEYVIPICHNISGETEFAYQKFPSFRVQMPNNLSVSKFHTDSDELHKHPKGEINFVVPLTKMYDTNTIWVQNSNNAEFFNPINAEVNNLICWNFNKLLHGNQINKTDDTRVSFDFRVLPISKYNDYINNYDSDNIKTVSNNLNFKIGSYYDYIKM